MFAFGKTGRTIVRRSSRDVVVFKHTTTESARVTKSPCPIYYSIVSSAATGGGGNDCLPTELTSRWSPDTRGGLCLC
jgi:hypothetical protein